MIGIYKITSPSNKVYIGQAINIDKRWKQYINPNSSSVGPKLLNSLNKYSFNKHVLEIIEECNLKQLNERETYYKYKFINEFGWKMALFCELYDNGGGPKSNETKQKQSISQKLNLSKPEIKEKRKINCKIAANKPGVQEKAVANTNWEQRELNRSKSMDYSKLKKPVIQYDLDRNFIKEWAGFIDIKINLNYDQSTIRKCCKNKQKTAYGFKWQYAAEALLS